MTGLDISKLPFENRVPRGPEYGWRNNHWEFKLIGSGMSPRGASDFEIIKCLVSLPTRGHLDPVGQFRMEKIPFLPLRGKRLIRL